MHLTHDESIVTFEDVNHEQQEERWLADIVQRCMSAASSSRIDFKRKAKEN